MTTASTVPTGFPPTGDGSKYPAAHYGMTLGEIFAAQIRSAAAAINDQLGVDSIREKLTNLPMQINGHQAAVFAAKGAVADAEQMVLAAKAELQAAIALETNPATLKPMFSNAEAREAELIRRQVADPGYKAAMARLRKAQEVYSQAQSAVEQLQNEFAAVKAVAHLVAGQLQLLGSH